MPDEGADVEALGPAVERGEVLGEGLEAPVDALVERLDRHALDVLEGAHDGVTVLGAGRGHAEPAVAHDHAGDAVPARGREVAVPEDLGVVVRVDVDEAGRQHQAVEVDDLVPAGAPDPVSDPGSADGGDPVTGDRDVGRPGRRAGAVDQRGVAQQQVHRRAASKAPVPRRRVGGSRW